jgi:hypothetical protein
LKNKISQRCDDFFVPDILINLLESFQRILWCVVSPKTVPYRGKSEDKLAEDLKKISYDLKDSLIQVREILRLSIEEEKKLERKTAKSASESEKKKFEVLLAEKNKRTAELRNLLAELEYKNTEFYFKMPALEARIRTSKILGSVNHSVSKIDWNKINEAIKNSELDVRKKEKLLAPPISDEELKQKEMVLEEALDELDLIRQLLEKMDKFIEANKDV